MFMSDGTAVSFGSSGGPLSRPRLGRGREARRAGSVAEIREGRHGLGYVGCFVFVAFEGKG